MRKVSAPGLGHLRPPCEADGAPADIPAPDASILGKGIERWHCDLWWQIISAAIDGHPDQVQRDYLGTTSRRHVAMTGTHYIGKESHDWERQTLLGLNLDSEIAYGQSIDDLSARL